MAVNQANYVRVFIYISDLRCIYNYSNFTISNRIKVEKLETRQLEAGDWLIY